MGKEGHVPFLVRLLLVLCLGFVSPAPRPTFKFSDPFSVLGPAGVCMLLVFTETIDMDTATSLEQEEAKLCNNLAECHLRLSNFEAAAEAASDALDADPSQVKGYYRRAKAQAELGRPGSQ